MMQSDPSNKWVLGPDAGQDRIYIWKLTGEANEPLSSPLRNFRDHSLGRWAAALRLPPQRALGLLDTGGRQYDHLLAVQSCYRKPDQRPDQVSSLPPGYVGTVFTSEIRVSADGRFVYGVNRLSDTICVFRIGGDGTLTQVSHTSTLGDYPRIIAIDPSGRFLVSGNQRADNVTTFRISGRRGDEHENDDVSHENDDVSGESRGSGDVKRKAGSLTFTGNYTAIGSPSGMVFLF